MEYILTFLASGAGATLAGALGKDWLIKRLAAALEKEVAVQKAALDVKLEACVEALSVVDAYFSTLDWGMNVTPEIQELSTEKARECYNKLALTCENPEVIETYANALGLRMHTEKAKQINADIIVDLRNLMRKELGFGSSIELPRETAWIVRLQKPSK